MYLYEVKEGDGKLGSPVDDQSFTPLLKKHSEGSVYLGIEGEGFSIFTFENKLIYNSYTMFKQFIHAGISKGILEKNYSSPRPRRIPLLGYELETDKIIVKDLDSEEIDTFTGMTSRSL